MVVLQASRVDYDISRLVSCLFFIFFRAAKGLAAIGERGGPEAGIVQQARLHLLPQRCQVRHTHSLVQCDVHVQQNQEML